MLTQLESVGPRIQMKQVATDFLLLLAPTVEPLPIPLKNTASYLYPFASFHHKVVCKLNFIMQIIIECTRRDLLLNNLLQGISPPP
jgi:hypothetical protein